jgi:hypothetical protein
MIVKIGTRQFTEKEYINGIFVALLSRLPDKNIMTRDM